MRGRSKPPTTRARRGEAAPSRQRAASSHPTGSRSTPTSSGPAPGDLRQQRSRLSTPATQLRRAHFNDRAGDRPRRRPSSASVSDGRRRLRRGHADQRPFRSGVTARDSGQPRGRASSAPEPVQPRASSQLADVSQPAARVKVGDLIVTAGEQNTARRRRSSPRTCRSGSSRPPSRVRWRRPAYDHRLAGGRPRRRLGSRAGPRPAVPGTRERLDQR